MNKQIGGGYRNPSIDILKGLAIVLVVYGHTWPFCREFIYLFHMAVFMMASGFCYTVKISSGKEYVSYLFRKLKGLYIPFIICNGCFTLLSPFFIKLGIYTDSSEITTLTSSWPITQSVYNYGGVTGILKQLAKVFLFIGPTQLGTATWFLTCLFVVLIVHSGLALLTKGLSCKSKQIIWSAVLLTMSILAQVVSTKHPAIIYVVKCFPCMYVSFLLGIILHDINWKHVYSWWMGLIALFILICMSFYFRIEVSAARIDNLWIFLSTSICGWIFLKSLSELIIRFPRVSSIATFIGKHTMVILCLHVLCFKIVSLIYLRIYKLPRVLLAGFHIIFDVNELWKVFYTIVGVGVPLLLYWVYDKSKTRITGK